MKRSYVVIPLIIFCLCGSYPSLSAQIEVQLSVTGGMATTTCTDFLTAPDPLWQVDVAGEGWIIYPEIGDCYTALPNLQYTALYGCLTDLPATVEVCFGVFENDNIQFEIGAGCGTDQSCLETICQDFTIPVPGAAADYTLELPDGLSSDGEVSFTISTVDSPSPDNNLICDAIDLGLIDFSGTLGDSTAGIYNNLCSDNLNEPNPDDNGSWFNNNAVWFSFTTDNDPARMLFFYAFSDPENTGDIVNLEMALYESDNGACDGNLSFVSGASDNSSLDLIMEGRCLNPNTTYFLMVDGAGQVSETRGIFSLQIDAIDVAEGPDARCDALALGAVPAGGSVSTPEPVANYCATDVGDPFVQAFVSQASVWFSFIAPPSGHVLIEAVSDTVRDPIGLQLAFYRAFNDNCASFFSHLGSVYSGADNDESFEASCLYGGERYFILIDGDGSNTRGIFTLTVSDAGDLTPITAQDTVICSGESLPVGNSLYSASGTYSDTIQIFAGCDSIINTTLTVLDPIEVSIDQTMPALGEGNANGVATASATGGAGNYTYLWCNGDTGPQSSSLVGGEECCVTVTDQNGCEAIECFTVEFVIDIIPFFENDSLACNGDMDGQIVFSVVNGIPPYNYSWQNAAGTLGGSGEIATEGEEVQIGSLPAGSYSFTVADNFSDTTFIALVEEPDPVSVTLIEQADASCFGFCDGSVLVDFFGGAGAFTLSWDNNLPAVPDPAGLCAGVYQLTVTDMNACEGFLSVDILEPEEFIAEVEVVQAVSCFEGADGQVAVTTNGNPASYEWNTGDDEASLNGLAAGIYEVTVTNEDGCEDIAFAEVPQPAEPVVAEIEILKGISCFGATDGVLSATVSGPGNSFVYAWSSGATGPVADGLPAGNYALEVTNEKGCTAAAVFDLPEPSEISVQLSSEDINCLNAPSGGVIQVDEISGGVPPFQFSLDGVLYGGQTSFPGLFEGAYVLVVQDAAGCEREFPATVMGPPELMVDLGEDLSLQLGDSTLLEALVNSNNVVYTWKTTDSLGLNGQSAIVVRPVESTGYQVEVIDTTTFCKATDFIFVTVVKDRKVFIPNAFSPNNDGQNDRFLIFGGAGIREVKTFRIFSRTGNMVFEVGNFQPNDPDYGWDGQLNGQAMNTGVYVFMAEIEFLDGEVEVFEGDLVLLR